MSPFFESPDVILYHADARELFTALPKADAIITDPPYGETSLDWDRWPESWPLGAALIAPQMWVFGSFRMFWERCDDLRQAGWKLAQDVIWEKHNGSNSSADRFRRVHEMAVHFYRGAWSEIYKLSQVTNDATARTVRRKRRPAHWGEIGEHHYVSEDRGPRLMSSVIFERSCHGYAVNETQKPEGIIAPLLRYSVPPGGLVIDPFAGSGTTGVVARKEGRRAILIESRMNQCEAIVERLGQKELELCE